MTLVVLLGPIASGKSTTAAALATRLPSCAVLDLDDVYFASEHRDWAVARREHAALVGASTADVVVAHGPLVLDELPADRPRTVVLLTTTYDVALERVRTDDTRLFSKDPVFLRRTYDEFVVAVADLVIDTTAVPVDDVVDAILTAIRG